MRYIIFFSIFFAIGFSNTTRVKSKIPIPQNKILKRYSSNCNSKCLTNLIIKGKVFTFLANMSNNVNNFALKEQKLILESVLNIKNNSSLDEIKIALLLPDKIIGRYSESTTKTVFSYLLTKKHKFQVKSYFIDVESRKSISRALNQINRDKFKFVIAPMTNRGATIISKLNPEIFIYFPTIHSSEIKDRSKYMFFGGIDYKAQIRKLVRYIKNRKISLFYDSSKKGRELNSIVVSELKRSKKRVRISLNRSVSKKHSDFSHLFKDNNKTIGNTYFLNTTKVKSSILLAQLTSFDQEPSLILSTQINYTPIILSMTQPYDRKKMLIANSISNIDNKKIVDTNLLFNNDIKYDWINYSTTVGIDYLFHLMSGKKRLYRERFVDNQLQYRIRVMKPLEAKFLEVK